MKMLLIAGLLAIGLTGSAAGQSLTAPARSHQIQHKKTAPVVRGEASGVIPRAIRGGNPLQMLNPRAPARYGTAEESVATEAYYPRRSTIEDPSYPGKWRGIKFFSVVF